VIEIQEPGESSFLKNVPVVDGNASVFLHIQKFKTAHQDDLDIDMMHKTTISTMKLLVVCYLLFLNVSGTSGWTLLTTTIRTTTTTLFERPQSTTTDVMYQPIFQFPNDIEWIDRLDDVIMGGISTSSVQPSVEGYARWIGVCRTDGGYVHKKY
jgi:hypothetical protein